MSLATIDPAPGLARSGPVGAVNAIVQWAGDLSTAARAVEMIVDTPFMPLSFWALPPGVQIRDFATPWMKHPRETDEEYQRRRQVTIASGAQAVVYGNEIGFTPQASLQSIYVVRGKPGMYAEAMSALVKSHGHEVVVEELSDRVCRVRGRRRGEQDWQRFEFTIERARRAGYEKQNPKYGSDPQTMLLPRCLSIACRAIAPDALKGLVAVEDITDEPDPDVTVTARTRTVQRAERPQLAAPAPQSPSDQPTTPAAPRAGAGAGASAGSEPAPRPAAAPFDGPPLPGEDASPEAPEPDTSQVKDDDVIDAKQWTAINARFVDLRDGGIHAVGGPGAQANRLAVINHITGRPVAKGSELTRGEAQLVLDTLAGAAGERLTRAVLYPQHGPEPTQDADQAAQDTEVGAEQDTPDPGDGIDPWAGAEHADRVGP